MELNQLEYFRVVAKLGNMTRAAEELYISQPNLSTCISRLERSLGVQLFERTRGHISLTENGRRLLEHVETVFQELDAAVFEIQEGKVYREDRIEIGSSFFGILMPLFLRSYQDYGLLPSTQLLLTNEEIEKRLEEGTLDLGIMTARPTGENLHAEQVCDAPLTAVMKQTAPLAAAGPVPMSYFAQAHFVCNMIYYDRELLTQLCRKAGFTPRMVRTSNEQEYFDESVDFGDNVSVCPVHLIGELTHSTPFHLLFVPITDSFAREQVYLVRRETDSRTPFIQEFYEYAKEQIADELDRQVEQGTQIQTRLLEHLG